MSSDERVIARILFANRLLKANNQSFQQFFWAIKRSLHGSDFVEIRPQGRKGDGGNDGYLPVQGHYFQVYGPIEPEEKVTEAAKKLVEDFDKLKSSWDGINPIRAWSFVYNDKYEGTFPDVAQALDEIRKVNPTVNCSLVTAAQLEDEFMSLSADQMNVIIGLLPDPAKIIRIDFQVLRDVIGHIMNSPAGSVTTRFGELPELDEKIRLNELCRQWGDLIRNASRHSAAVDQYFSRNSTFLKQALRDHIVESYRRVRDAGKSASNTPVGIRREDLIFDDFRRGLLPENATRAMEDSVEILIGYYFEACDVFDPHAEKSGPNASA